MSYDQIKGSIEKIQSAAQTAARLTPDHIEGRNRTDGIPFASVRWQIDASLMLLPSISKRLFQYTPPEILKDIATAAETLSETLVRAENTTKQTFETNNSSTASPTRSNKTTSPSTPKPCQQ